MTRKEKILKKLDAIIELTQENLEFAEKMYRAQAEKIVYLAGLRESIAESKLYQEYEAGEKVPQIDDYDPFNFPGNKEEETIKVVKGNYGYPEDQAFGPKQKLPKHAQDEKPF